MLYIAALAVFAVSGYMMLVSLRRLKAEEKIAARRNLGGGCVSYE
ncbi:MAG: hypothetical protein ACLRX8_07510 [Alistipes sp.]